MSDRLGSIPGLGYAGAVHDHPVVQLTGADAVEARAMVAEEVPVALVYNGRSHVVVMASPGDLDDLAIGFSLTEGIVPAASDVQRIETVRHSRGIEMQMDIPAELAALLDDRRRTMSARTGCGLCGVEALDDLLRLPPAITDGATFSTRALWRASAALAAHQPLNQETRAVHAAAWCAPDGDLRVAREDVGRHNALDKVIGALARSGTDAASGFMIVSSRASYELVLKCAMAGIPLLGAVSRPTSLAIRIAHELGMTLVGLLRGESATVYAHPQRIQSV